MKVITCITDPEYIGYKYGLKASCEYHKLNLISLIDDDLEWKTHRHKDYNLKKYLKTLDSSEIVLFTDGYDTIFIGDEKEILERYERVTNFKKILISAEINCYPDLSLAEQYLYTESPFKYLNSGGFIGKAEQILKVLENIELKTRVELQTENQPFQWSNQYGWTLAFLDMKADFILDTKCDLFQSFAVDTITSQQHMSLSNNKRKIKSFSINKMNDILANFEIRNGKVFNQMTLTFPVHLHFNTPITKFGMFRYPFLSIIEDMNYQKN